MRWTIVSPRADRDRRLRGVPGLLVRQQRESQALARRPRSSCFPSSPRRFRAAAGSVGRVLKCPRCRSRLLDTQDMQRNTRFSYSRCPHGHGRFTTFFNFLREKDFVRPLSAAQLDELRQHVQTVNCSNCGAPIDLAHASSCGHCGSALSILDMQQAEKVVEQLRRAVRAATGGSGTPARAGTSAARDRRDVRRNARHDLAVERCVVDRPGRSRIERGRAVAEEMNVRKPEGFRLPTSGSLNVGSRRPSGLRVYCRNWASCARVRRHCDPIFLPFKSPASRLAMTSASLTFSSFAASAGVSTSAGPGST